MSNVLDALQTLLRPTRKKLIVFVLPSIISISLAVLSIPILYVLGPSYTGSVEAFLQWVGMPLGLAIVLLHGFGIILGIPLMIAVAFAWYIVSCLIVTRTSTYSPTDQETKPPRSIPLTQYAPRFCLQCGKRLRAGSKFCLSCGAPIRKR